MSFLKEVSEKSNEHYHDYPTLAQMLANSEAIKAVEDAPGMYGFYRVSKTPGFSEYDSRSHMAVTPDGLILHRNLPEDSLHIWKALALGERSIVSQKRFELPVARIGGRVPTENAVHFRKYNPVTEDEDLGRALSCFSGFSTEFYQEYLQNYMNEFGGIIEPFLDTLVACVKNYDNALVDEGIVHHHFHVNNIVTWFVRKSYLDLYGINPETLLQQDPNSPYTINTIPVNRSHIRITPWAYFTNPSAWTFVPQVIDFDQAQLVFYQWKKYPLPVDDSFLDNVETTFQQMQAYMFIEQAILHDRRVKGNLFITRREFDFMQKIRQDANFPTRIFMFDDLSLKAPVLG